MDMMLLGLEAQSMIAQRVAMFAPGAQAEAQRMILETLDAGGEAVTMMSTGASNEAVIHIYRRTIRANARRLATR